MPSRSYDRSGEPGSELPHFADRSSGTSRGVPCRVDSDSPPKQSLVARFRVVIPLTMCVAGAIWFTQGMGWLKGSFMTGDSTYTYLGAALFAVGGLLLAWHRRSTSHHR